MRDVQAELFRFNDARARDEAQSGRRTEGFPNGGIIKHAQFLAVTGRKVNAVIGIEICRSGLVRGMIVRGMEKAF